MLYQRFAKNEQGNDYICSDIHGHFDLLEERMQLVGFNPECDRIFSLGDLIDRGEQSSRSLEFLAQPWFHAVQGNHERMLMNVVEQNSDVLRFQWFSWGGEWAENLSDDELQRYYDVFVQLPAAIELDVDEQRSVGLVHAELPDICDWIDVKEHLSQIPIHKVEEDDCVSDMLWNRRQPYFSDEKRKVVQNVANISHVFHGHTIVDAPLTIANRTFMDLGSYRNFTIGFINPRDFLDLR